jgi:hypothetical protein
MDLGSSLYHRDRCWLVCPVLPRGDAHPFGHSLPVCVRGEPLAPFTRSRRLGIAVHYVADALSAANDNFT